jgi:hypothetical protein
VAEIPSRRSLPPEEFVTPRVEFLTHEVYPRAKTLWDDLGGGSVFLEARLHVPEAQASRAALTLYDIDREARRAVRIIVGRGIFDPAYDVAGEVPVAARLIEQARTTTPRRLLRPAPIRVGGFRLLRAEEGSADFFLDAYGLLAAVLLADPVQLALTLKSIFGWPARVVIRRTLRGEHESEDHDLGQWFDFGDQDLRLAGRLAAGSTLEFRYRRPDGTEIETKFET